MLLTYVKEPGYIYDLLSVYYFHFNKEAAFEEVVTDNRRAEDTTFFKQMLKMFPVPPLELYPIFRFDSTGHTLITAQFYTKYLHHFFKGNGIDYLYERILEPGALKSALLSTYFNSDYFSEEAKKCSQFDLMIRVDKLTIDEEAKKYLLIALTEPEELARRTVDFLKSAEPILKKYFLDNSVKIEALFKYYNSERIVELFQTGWGEKYDWANVPGFLSIGLLAGNSFRYQCMEDGMGYVIGQFAESSSKHMLAMANEIDLGFVGKAFGDKNRVVIWELLTTHREMSTTEIAERLQLPLSSCFYHLDLMQRSKILSSRSEGKTIFYSVNADFVRQWQQKINSDIQKMEGLE